jgi:hypothetical protein
MAYSQVSDLLLGDMNPGSIDLQKFVDAAKDEMDSKLGFVYDLPLSPLTSTESLLLKDINNKLASGRIILAQYVGGEDNNLHAYGASLIKEAHESLMLIANGVIDLSSGLVPTTEAGTKTPLGVVYDEESMVTAFEETVYRGVPTFAQPGEAP